MALFAVTINDISGQLHTAIGRSLSYMISQFRTRPPASVVSRQLQLAVVRLEKWSKKNALRFSTSKTVAVPFCRRQCSCLDLCIRLYGQRIPTRLVVNFLGVILDRRLTYK